MFLVLLIFSDAWWGIWYFCNVPNIQWQRQGKSVWDDFQVWNVSLALNL